jgi:hypothetical protein
MKDKTKYLKITNSPLEVTHSSTIGLTRPLGFEYSLSSKIEKVIIRRCKVWFVGWIGLSIGTENASVLL